MASRCLAARAILLRKDGVIQAHVCVVVARRLLALAPKPHLALISPEETCSTHSVN